MFDNNEAPTEDGNYNNALDGAQFARQMLNIEGCEFNVKAVDLDKMVDANSSMAGDLELFSSVLNMSK